MRANRLCWWVVIVLLLSGQAHADWKRDYVRGERAIRDGNFAEAEALFRAAARDEPTPDERKRFEGVVFRDYAPQFWAGFAAWRQGACDRALEYWQDSANSAAVLSKIKDFKSQQDRGLADCRQTLAQTTKPPPPVATAPAPAPTQPVVTTPPIASQPPPTKPPVVAPPSQPAVTVTPTPAPATTVPAPAQLVSAVQGWLAGRYSDVLAVQPNAISDGRARAYVHMLRAAARFAESELGTASSEKAAQDEVRAARRALSSISPDATLFSPRFRAFWQTTR